MAEPLTLPRAAFNALRLLTVAIDKARAEGAAAERDVIVRLAVEHGAVYFAEERPCDCRSGCGLLTRPRVPFADLIRKERGND